MTAEQWIDAVIERHTKAMTRPEFLKAVRALSARYVEQRATLKDRPAHDSAGKRAAFAAFYAPMHFVTTREIVRRLGAGRLPIATMTDLGCGTGVAGAAWALECEQTPSLVGIDVSAWTLDEAKWNWGGLGLRGRGRRGNLSRALEEFDASPRTALILAWSLNELDAAARARATACLISLANRRVPIVVIEPIATRVVPWWPAWAQHAAKAGGRIDEWKFDAALPAALAELDEAAGFRRESLSARSVSFNTGQSAC
jgi:methylase of polypeptide subunit release factors